MPTVRRRPGTTRKPATTRCARRRTPPRRQRGREPNLPRNLPRPMTRGRKPLGRRNKTASRKATSYSADSVSNPDPPARNKPLKTLQKAPRPVRFFCPRFRGKFISIGANYCRFGRIIAPKIAPGLTRVAKIAYPGNVGFFALDGGRWRPGWAADLQILHTVQSLHRLADRKSTRLNSSHL